jgi:hypothetical protein
LLASATATASAETTFFNGNEVCSWCQRTNDVMVLGYVAGLSDQSSLTIGTLRTNLFSSPRDDTEVHLNAGMMLSLELVGRHCLPAKATVGQVKDVFCGYLRETPQDRHLPAAVLFHKAMQRAWPCK